MKFLNYLITQKLKKQTTKTMDTKFNMSKETQNQLLEVYEYRIQRLQDKIKSLESIIKQLS